MRRLPIYFLIDVSESMVGEPIGHVQDGIETIVKELRSDPYALETVYLSIITFAGKAKKITNMVELFNFYPPKLSIGGGTSLGAALDFLMQDISQTVQKTTLEEKGDWKPIIFLFTDGNPTDDYARSFECWNQKYRKSSNLIIVSLGENTDVSIFGKITDQILLLHHTDAASYQKFFKWITASIKTSSVSVSENNDDAVHLAPITNGYLSKIDLEKHIMPKIDENFAVILAKCQTTQRPYLIKYQKRLSPSQLSDMFQNVMDYRLVGAYPIDDSYFELSDGNAQGGSVNTSLLTGFPSCPCCGNQYGFSHCACGNILCTGEEEITKCPWCHTEARFGFEEGGVNITRTKG